jgi:hypothetical protein
MTTLIQLVLAATVAAAAAPSIAADREEPRHDVCDMSLWVGHVPGRLEPVWMLRCPA